MSTSPLEIAVVLLFVAAACVVGWNLASSRPTLRRLALAAVLVGAGLALAMLGGGR